MFRWQSHENDVRVHVSVGLGHKVIQIADGRSRAGAFRVREDKQHGQAGAVLRQGREEAVLRRSRRSPGRDLIPVNLLESINECQCPEDNDRYG
jgi:hypothetical protein